MNSSTYFVERSPQVENFRAWESRVSDSREARVYTSPAKKQPQNVVWYHINRRIKHRRDIDRKSDTAEYFDCNLPPLISQEELYKQYKISQEVYYDTRCKFKKTRRFSVKQSIRRDQHLNKLKEIGTVITKLSTFQLKERSHQLDRLKGGLMMRGGINIATRSMSRVDLSTLTDQLLFVKCNTPLHGSTIRTCKEPLEHYYRCKKGADCISVYSRYDKRYRNMCIQCHKEICEQLHSPRNVTTIDDKIYALEMSSEYHIEHDEIQILTARTTTNKSTISRKQSRINSRLRKV